MNKIMEDSVYKVVVATVGDYDRMRRMLEKGTVEGKKALEFARRIDAIDNALVAVCKGECEAVRVALLYDIARERGFDKSAAKQYFTSINTFKRRKREAIEMIAEMLGLV